MNRLGDEFTQRRVREEAEAVRAVLASIERGEMGWVISDAVVAELVRTPNEKRRMASLLLLESATEHLTEEASIMDRASHLQAAGFGGFDALHLAYAESAKVNAFLTVDDRLLRKAHRSDGRLLVVVANPLPWSKENLLWTNSTQ